MPDEYLSLTDLGQLYGGSRVRAGQWLVDVGLRNKEKKPSQAAFQGGFVSERPSTNPGTYYWVWHRERTMRVLDAAGHRRAGNDATS
jgi:hypothetical protein